MRRIGGLLGVAVIMTVTSLRVPAAGAAGDGRTVGAGSVPASIEAYAEQWSVGGPRSPGGACSRWRQADAADAAAHAWDLVEYSGGFKWRLYSRICGPTEQATWILVDPIEPVADWLIERIRKEQQLPQPTLGSAPPADSMFVNLGTWFWDEGKHWDDHPSAAVGFPNLTVRVTATPTQLTYHSGYSEHGRELTASCTGNEPVWVESYGDDMESPCMFTYEHSSDIAPNGHSFAARLQLDWTVAWYLNGRFQANLDPQSTTQNLDVTVKEIQAIVVA